MGSTAGIQAARWCHLQPSLPAHRPARLLACLHCAICTCVMSLLDWMYAVLQQPRCCPAQASFLHSSSINLTQPPTLLAVDGAATVLLPCSSSAARVQRWRTLTRRSGCAQTGRRPTFAGEFSSSSSHRSGVHVSASLTALHPKTAGPGEGPVPQASSLRIDGSTHCRSGWASIGLGMSVLYHCYNKGTACRATAVHAQIHHTHSSLIRGRPLAAGDAYWRC